MLINIQNKYNEIEQHIIDNQRDIFSMYNYYTNKWKGNRLNDVNVGVFVGDGNIPTVQIFVRNVTGYIKTHMLFNKAGNKIIDIKTLNTTFLMNNKNNPKELEYWRNIFPTKTETELEEYRVRWGKDNPKYLKFKRD
jgi:hypothetical protein